MKNSPSDLVTAAIAEFYRVEADIAALQKQNANAAARLTSLEIEGDLSSEEVLSEIARLQVFTTLFPRRIAARESLLPDAQGKILELTNELISQHLMPKLRALREQARSQAKASLAPLYNEPSALNDAIESSKGVAELSGLYTNTSLQDSPIGGVFRFADGILQKCKRAAEIEKSINAVQTA